MGFSPSKIVILAIFEHFAWAKNGIFGPYLISGDDDEIWRNIIPCNIDL